MIQTSSNRDEKGATTARRSWSFAGILVIVLSLVACGGQTSTENGAETSTPADEPAVTTTTAETKPEGSTPSSTSEPGGVSQQGDSDSPFGQLGFEGGAATLTLAGETVEFDFFACFSGSEAVEFYGDEDATFVAVGQSQTSTATATLFLVSTDGPFGLNYTTFYTPAGGSERAWQDVGFDAAFAVDGDRVTHAGEFSRIVDGALTEETDSGSLDATCG